MAVFVVVGCCLTLGCLGKAVDRAEQTKCHLLGPEMLQLLFEPEVGTWDLASLSWGQFVAGWSKSLSLPDLFIPQPCLQRRGLLPGAGDGDSSTQEVATFGWLGDVAALEL